MFEKSQTTFISNVEVVVLFSFFTVLFFKEERDVMFEHYRFDCITTLFVAIVKDDCPFCFCAS